MTDTPKKRGRPRKTAPPPKPEITALQQLVELVRQAHGNEAAAALTQVVDDARNYRELTEHLDATVQGLAVHKKE